MLYFVLALAASTAGVGGFMIGRRGFDYVLLAVQVLRGSSKIRLAGSRLSHFVVTAKVGDALHVERSQLREAKIADCILRDSSVARTTMPDLRILDSLVERTRFELCDMPRSVVTDSLLREVSFSRCELRKAITKESIFQQSKFDQVMLESCKTMETVFLQSSLWQTVFHSCTLTDCSFEASSSLDGVECIWTDFQNLSFEDSSMSRSYFSDCNFVEVTSESLRCNDVKLESCEFYEGGFAASDFGRSQFLDTLMQDCTFTDVNFVDCTFPRTRFSQVKFANCRFVGVNWSFAQLSQCEFENCEFEDMLAYRLAVVDTELPADFRRAVAGGVEELPPS